MPSVAINEAEMRDLSLQAMRDNLRDAANARRTYRRTRDAELLEIALKYEQSAERWKERARKHGAVL